MKIRYKQKKDFLLIMVIIMLLLSSCHSTTMPESDEYKNDDSFEESTNLSKDEDESFDISDLEIISVSANGQDITNETNVDWLKSSIENSTSTSSPKDKMALILNVELVFNDDSIATIKLLDDVTYKIYHENKSYILMNDEITEWLFTIE